MNSFPIGRFQGPQNQVGFGANDEWLELGVSLCFFCPRKFAGKRKSQQFKTDELLGGGNSNIFYFHPEPWGNDPI